MPAGRPFKYDRKIVLERLRDYMAQGISLSKACLNEGMPSSEYIYKWVQDDEELFQIFMRAQELWCLKQADVIVEICDDQSRDVIENIVQAIDENGDPTTRIERRSDNTAVNRDKLRVQTRQWAMNKLAKKHFGDKSELEHKGEVSHNIFINRKPKADD